MLYAAYEAATGHAYPRPEPQAGKDTADSLNNRAVSLLDLGREAEADPLLGPRAAQPAAPPGGDVQPGAARLAGGRRLRRGDADAHGRGGEDARLVRARAASCWAGCSSRSATTRRPRRASRTRSAPACARPSCTASSASRSARRAPPHRDAAQPWVRATECLAGALQAGGEDPAEIAGYALSLVRLGQEEKGRGLLPAGRRSSGAACPPELQDAVARFLPGHEAGLTLKGLVRTRDRRGGDAGRTAGARERRREHPRRGTPRSGRPCARCPCATRACARWRSTVDGTRLLWGGEGDAAAAPRPARPDARCCRCSATPASPRHSP